MIIINLINGDIVEMPKANYQQSDNNGDLSYYDNSDKNKKWIGTLTRAGNFVNVPGHGNHITRHKGNTLSDIIIRIKQKDGFNWKENEEMLKLKSLLTHAYLPKRGSYK